MPSLSNFRVRLISTQCTCESPIALSEISYNLYDYLIIEHELKRERTMHYICLYVAHRAFYWAEPRAHYYDEYMRHKNREKWVVSVSLNEVKKLFDFILHWDFHFQGDPKKFQECYAEIFPIIKNLEDERLEDANFNDRELRNKIEQIFDKVANCAWRYESTDASKILHTILPKLFVMWDRKIRKEILGSENRNWGGVYATEFLPKMQEELIEAIRTCKQKYKLGNKEAAQHVSQLCDNKTLPKLIDEYNYMTCTRPADFRDYVEKLEERIKELREENEISAEDYKRLLNDILFVKKTCLRH